jgi:hypothetical protein
MKGSQESLTTVVIKHGQAAPASSSTDGSRQGLWPTPEASQGGRQGGSFNQTSWKNADGTPRQPSLAQAAIKEVKQWATPDVSDKRSDKSTQIGLRNQISGKLNPRWVETLMGLPVGWTMPSCVSPTIIAPTSCAYLGTGLCQPPQP